MDLPEVQVKRELKVGDRVSVYLGGTHNVVPSRRVAMVIDFSSFFNERQKKEWLRVRYDDGSDYSVHRGQCRLIKPKKKPREFWLNVYEEVVSGAYSTKQDADKFASADRLECILVKEVVGK